MIERNLLKIRWKAWEYALVAVGWLFGYGHSYYYAVKHRRNMAYFAYTFYKG